jgi:RNA polymerase sigma-70 factor (ECF subfamily)
MTVTEPSHEPLQSISLELLEEARAGSPAALEELFRLCRPYLMEVANAEFPANLSAKAGASDLVQQSCLEAHQNFGQFKGTSPGEFLHWLRRILLNNEANFERTFGAEKRNVGREEALDIGPLHAAEPAAQSGSPSEKAEKREELDRLFQAIARLPEDYRRVIECREQEQLPWEQVGERLNRSAEAARKLWVRAIKKLSEELGEKVEGGQSEQSGSSESSESGRDT